jgi:cob(I)alamin adenosyltransferase
MSRIYTRTGDSGETGLIGGSRIAKTSPRITAVGEVDELNACLGVARVHASALELDPLLSEVQHRLFDLGAELAAPGLALESISREDIVRLEESMDSQTLLLEPLKQFILPGGSPLASALHQARCVCRRAERAVLDLHAEEPVREDVLRYVNRLSDWLFTAARTANRLGDVPDVKWEKKL